MVSDNLKYRFAASGLVATALLAVWGCGLRGPNLDSAHAVYRHEVKRGETLQSIAEEYYGDPRKARLIGAVNEIEDETIRPGTVLRIPMDAEDVERLQAREQARKPYNDGLKLAEQGAYIDAVSRFQEALEVDPGFVDARYNLGVTFHKLKSYKKALEQFRMIVRERPEKAEYFFAAGNAHFHLDEYDYAARAFEAVMRHEPDHIKALYSLALSYEKLGKLVKAREVWRRYLELDDTSAWATEARRRLRELQ